MTGSRLVVWSQRWGRKGSIRKFGGMIESFRVMIVFAVTLLCVFAKTIGHLEW